MGCQVIKLLMDNNRKTVSELIEYCEAYYKAGMITEDEYNYLMKELKSKVQ